MKIVTLIIHASDLILDEQRKRLRNCQKVWYSHKLLVKYNFMTGQVINFGI